MNFFNIGDWMVPSARFHIHSLKEIYNIIDSNNFSFSAIEIVILLNKLFKENNAVFACLDYDFYQTREYPNKRSPIYI